MKLTNNNFVYLYFVYDGDSRKVYENGIFFKCIIAEKRAKGLNEIGKRAFIVPLKVPKDKAFNYDFHNWCNGSLIDDIRYLCGAYMVTATEREEWHKKKLMEYQKMEDEFLKSSIETPVVYDLKKDRAINQEDFFSVDSSYKQLELFEI